jgi:uncharacterized membrane protein
MPLYFRNWHTSDAYVALVSFDVFCGPTNTWRKSGWYRVPSGQTALLISTDLSRLNRYMSWYADVYQGGPDWRGTGNNYYLVPSQAFNQCFDDNSNCFYQPDFNVLDINGHRTVEVNLLQPGSYYLLVSDTVSDTVSSPS